ncbi:MAG: hypothetical protein P9L99_03980 [Candidatus Lernaella stagnicola]|nr:hypothetical protein [Candidatus Lernaella stagnicola]
MRTSGLFLCLLAGLLVSVPALAGDDPSEPPGLDTAMQRIEKLKSATPQDIDALHEAYLVLFENFSARQQAKEAIFDLFALLEKAGRKAEALAVLARIESVYQDHETMAYPGHNAWRVALVATAKIEEAYLYAEAMNNPYQAIDTLKQTTARHSEQNVGVAGEDRHYFGRVEIICALETARYRVATGQANLASTDLLSVVRQWGGADVLVAGVPQTAAVAAVRRLPEVLGAMPASLPKKGRVLDTFAQTTVPEEARAWLGFVRAATFFQHAQKWRAKGAFADGAETLREIIRHHRTVMLVDETGKEPAGIKAMRRLRDAELLVLRNTVQAAQSLEEFRAKFGKNKADRLFAGYATLFLAELEFDFRKNAPAAFQLFMRVADDFGDLPLYPQMGDDEKTIAAHAKLWAKRAQERM